MKKKSFIIILSFIFLISCGKKQNFLKLENHTIQKSKGSSKVVKKNHPVVSTSEFKYLTKIENASELRQKLHDFNSQNELEVFISNDLFIEELARIKDKVSFLYGYFNIEEVKISTDSIQKRIEAFFNVIGSIDNVSSIDDYFIQKYFLTLMDLFDWQNKYVKINIESLSKYLGQKLDLYSLKKNKDSDVRFMLFYYKPILRIISSRENRRELYFTVFSEILFNFDLQGELEEDNLGLIFLDSLPLFVRKIDHKSSSENAMLFSNLNYAFMGIGSIDQLNMKIQIRRTLKDIQEILMKSKDILLKVYPLYEYFIERNLILKRGEFFKNYSFDYFGDTSIALLFNIYTKISDDDIESKILDSKDYYEVNKNFEVFKIINDKNLLKTEITQNLKNISSDTNIRKKIINKYDNLKSSFLQIFDADYPNKFDDSRPFENFSKINDSKQIIILEADKKINLFASGVYKSQDLLNLNEDNYYSSDLTLVISNGEDILSNKKFNFENIWVDSSGLNGVINKAEEYTHRAPYDKFIYRHACSTTNSAACIEATLVDYNDNKCAYSQSIKHDRTVWNCNTSSGSCNIVRFPLVNGLGSGFGSFGKKWDICSFKFGYSIDEIKQPLKQSSGKKSGEIDLINSRFINSLVVAKGGNGVEGDKGFNGYACTLTPNQNENEESKFNRFLGASSKEEINFVYDQYVYSYNPSRHEKGIVYTQNAGQDGSTIRMSNLSTSSITSVVHTKVGKGGDGGDAGLKSEVKLSSSFSKSNVLLQSNGLPGLGGSQSPCGQNAHIFNRDYMGKTGSF